jgi:hypothetical protein
MTDDSFKKTPLRVNTCRGFFVLKNSIIPTDGNEKFPKNKNYAIKVGIKSMSRDSSSS